MKNIYYAIFAALTLLSCSKSYNITGTSNSSRLDGNMLFLTPVKADAAKNIDSCDVVHGEFHFSGAYDSVQVVMINVNGENIIPIVLEDGNIVVTLNNTEISCKGTEMNDTLNSFLKKYEVLNNQLQDLDKQMRRAEFDFYTNELEDPQATQQKILTDQSLLLKDIDNLFTNFVVGNFDNILGPFIFLYRAGMESGGYYELTPWVESIMAKATERFKNNADVKDYITNAQKRKNIENGMETPDVAPLNGSVGSNASQPTPAQMAEQAQ